MRPDQGSMGKPPRRSHTAPVPGMPYRLHAETDEGASTDGRREQGFIESKPMADQRAAMGRSYNPWEEQGWAGGGETPYAMPPDAGLPPEEQYFTPMPDLRRNAPNAYAAERPFGPDAEQTPAHRAFDVPGGESFADPYAKLYTQPYPERYDEPYPEADEPEETAAQEPLPPPLQPGKRRAEPWRTAVILSCVAGLLFCGVEIYRIAQSIADSEAAIQAYRTMYLKENNVDFMRGAAAVALRPPGETYPPTASPEPAQTPSPSPRIAQNDPLIAAMSGGGLNPDQSVAPAEITPVPRSALARYPLNPLLVIRDDIAALQAENADIVGRLTIDGVLSELVVQRNNTYYLNHNAMGAYSGYGAVFADENVNFRVPPENIVLYARTANAGKTFASLSQYESQGIEFAGRHAFFSFDTLYEQARYVVIAVVKTDADPASADAVQYKRLAFATDGEMLSFAREAMEHSLYGFGVGVLPTDRLLTLITLSDGGDSSGLIILCRMLRNGESDGVLQQDGAAP